MPAVRTHDGPYTIHSYAASFGLDYWLLPVDGASHRDDGPMQATTSYLYQSHSAIIVYFSHAQAQDLSLSTTNCLFLSPAPAQITVILSLWLVAIIRVRGNCGVVCELDFLCRCRSKSCTQLLFRSSATPKVAIS